MNAEDIHRCDYYLKVLEGYGIKVQDRLCELRLKAEDMQICRQQIKQGRHRPQGKLCGVKYRRELGP